MQASNEEQTIGKDNAAAEKREEDGEYEGKRACSIKRVVVLSLSHAHSPLLLKLSPNPKRAIERCASASHWLKQELLPAAFARLSRSTTLTSSKRVHLEPFCRQRGGVLVEWTAMLQRTRCTVFHVCPGGSWAHLGAREGGLERPAGLEAECSSPSLTD
jgi:hypothetical protein